MSSNWQHKLKDYSETPPLSAWDAIAERLEAQEASFPQKLHQYEETPPAAAWDKIQQQLPAAQGAKVTRLKWLRYAAAAVVLLALAGIGYLSTPDNKDNTTVANTTIQNNLPGNTPTAPPVKKETKHLNTPPQVTKVKEVSADETPKPRLQYAAAAAGRRIQAKRAQANLPVEPAFVAELDVVPTSKNIINAERANRYMIATSDEGAPVRLTKKVYSAFACPDEDANNQACETQLARLQQKISASFTTDFVQFLDLLKNLQENSK